MISDAEQTANIRRTESEQAVVVVSQDQRYWSIGQAAKVLGVNRVTLGDLVRLHAIPTVPMAQARIVDQAGMARLAELLGKDWPVAE